MEITFVARDFRRKLWTHLRWDCSQIIEVEYSVLDEALTLLGVPVEPTDAELDQGAEEYFRDWWIDLYNDAESAETFTRFVRLEVAKGN